ncbi:MAG TPA: hypothetical protein V6C85_07915 [Allocoleopsis sp.]
MQNYQFREQLEDSFTEFHGFLRHHVDINRCPKASEGDLMVFNNRERVGGVESQYPLRSNRTVSKAFEDVKQRLASSCDRVRIAALKEALQYGKDGFQLVKKIIKTERGLVQLMAFDLLWEKANFLGKQRLLNYLARHPEVCTNYIEKVLEPSLVSLEAQQERRHQALATVCQAQELVKQRYNKALSQTAKSQQSDREGRISSSKSLTTSEGDAQPASDRVSFKVECNANHSAPSTPIDAKALSQEVSALKAKLDQQTILIKTLLPNLVLISKLFEAKAKKYLFEAQTFTKAIEQIEQGLFKLEADWQELERLAGGESSPLQLRQRLEMLMAQLQNHLILLHQTVARAITTQLQIQHHYTLIKKAADYCKYRGQLDWQEGNEDWARESLVRRKRYLDTAAILKFGLARQTPQLQVLHCHLFVLQGWLSLSREMKHALLSESSTDGIQIARTGLRQMTKFP